MTHPATRCASCQHVYASHVTGRCIASRRGRRWGQTCPCTGFVAPAPKTIWVDGMELDENGNATGRTIG